MRITADHLAPEYDVVVIGGSLSGAATATLLRRKAPDARVLVIEKSQRFGRRVGEATVEVSAFFLGRVLGLTKFLNETQLMKQGLRFWFANDRVNSIDEASEIGPRYLARIPSYQLDRATVDEEVLRRAVDGGIDLLRPATVTGVDLVAGGMQTIALKCGDERREIRARWVVDASGITAMLSRRNGWWRPNADHPTASAWARWKGVKDWDGRELAERHPDWAHAHHGIRGTATNHIVGDGWWSWWIPLKGGDTSVGIVFDQRLVDFPKEGGNLGERLKAFLMRHPVAREMIADATHEPGDVHWRKNLSYQSDRHAGDGFALVGDAAAFLDPFYSPGMDWVSFSASCTAELVAKSLSGADTAMLVEKHNATMRLCLRRWFDALYRNKYQYLGDYELMELAFQLDLGLYYWGVVRDVFDGRDDGFLTPPFTHPAAGPFAWLMKTYNHRLAKIGARRRRIGTFGAKNDRHQRMVPGFTIARGEIRRIVPLLFSWLKLELTEGWRCGPLEPQERYGPIASHETSTP